MQDLTGDARFPAYLSPSSMQAGNTVAGDPQLAMTAPGSLSVLPVVDKMDVLPQPRFTNDTAIPVSHPGSREKVTVQGSSNGGGRFTDAHDIPNASRWAETS